METPNAEPFAFENGLNGVVLETPTAFVSQASLASPAANDACWRSIDRPPPDKSAFRSKELTASDARKTSRFDRKIDVRWVTP